MMVCSYQKPEPWQPSYRSPMPPNMPSPEESKDEAALCRERAAAAGDERLKKLWIAAAEVLSPLYVLFSAKRSTAASG